jgi:hypothetical protein
VDGFLVAPDLQVVPGTPQMQRILVDAALVIASGTVAAQV